MPRAGIGVAVQSVLWHNAQVPFDNQLIWRNCQLKSQELRPGMAIEMEDQIWLVAKYEHVKPGKGPAYAQVKLKNLITGGHLDKRFRSSETVEQINLDRREMEYLYSDSSGAVFMDSETYDQTTIDVDVLADALKYIKPNTSVNGLVYKGNVVSIELPSVVELKITDTSPGIKGATATNQFKEAIELPGDPYIRPSPARPPVRKGTASPRRADRSSPGSAALAPRPATFDEDRGRGGSGRPSFDPTSCDL